MMDWSAIKQDFEPDGSLRDIYVLDTSIVDWRAVWDVLRQFSPPCAFSIDGIDEAMPEDVQSVFDKTLEANCLLRLSVEGIVVCCHFFSPEEIEFDIWPGDVCGPDDAQALERFMTWLGEVTGKTVLLTSENVQTEVIAQRFPLEGKIVWIPPEEEG